MTDVVADEAVGVTAPEGLSPHESALLDFETGFASRTVPRETKDARIRERFGTSATRYYHQLYALLDRPAALAAYPGLVSHLLRQRDARRSARSAVRLASR